MNEKTWTNSIYPNQWVPAASLLQGLTVMQQSVYQMKFRNVCEIKKQLVQPGLVWSSARNGYPATRGWCQEIAAARTSTKLWPECSLPRPSVSSQIPGGSMAVLKSSSRCGGQRQCMRGWSISSWNSVGQCGVGYD